MNGLVKQLVRQRDKDLSITLRFDPGTDMVSAELARGNVKSAFAVSLHRLIRHSEDLMPLFLIPRYASFDNF